MSIMSPTYKDDLTPLIERCRKHDRTAQNELHKILYRYVFAICYRYVGTVAETKEVATERVRFFAEMNYAKNGESKSTDLTTVPDEISMPTAIDPKYSFKYWETSGVQSLNYIMGAQYQWRTGNKFHPYIAAAFHGTTTLPFDVDFEYIDKMTGSETSFKQKTTLFSHFNRIYGAVGVHWNAFPNGQLSAETYVTTPVGNDRDLIPTQIGLKIGVFYLIKFKNPTQSPKY